MMTLKPADGRQYETLDQAQADFDAGAQFLIHRGGRNLAPYDYPVYFGRHDVARMRLPHGASTPLDVEIEVIYGADGQVGQLST